MLAIVTECSAATEKSYTNSILSGTTALVSYFIFFGQQINITKIKSILPDIDLKPKVRLVTKLIHGSVESVRVMKPSVSLIFQSLFLNGNILGQLWRYSVQIPLHSIKRLCVLDGGP